MISTYMISTILNSLDEPYVFEAEDPDDDDITYNSTWIRYLCIILGTLFLVCLIFCIIAAFKTRPAILTEIPQDGLYNESMVLSCLPCDTVLETQRGIALADKRAIEAETRATEAETRKTDAETSRTAAETIALTESNQARLRREQFYSNVGGAFQSGLESARGLFTSRE
jgi:hypothetical protein